MLELKSRVEAATPDKVDAAVGYLTASPRSAHLVNRLATVVDNWYSRKAVFGGDDAVLNALVALGVRDRQALADIFTQVEQSRQGKREAARLRRRRARKRVAMATALAEQLEGRPFTPAERTAYHKHLVMVWRERMRSTFRGDRMTLEARREFWDMIDDELERATST